MTLTDEQTLWFQQTFDRLVESVGQVILGKQYVIRLAFTALLSEGHILLEDYPGTGKTSLARSMAQTLSGKSSRIQFTPDLLPGDVTGVTVFDQTKGAFEFHPGPIFANIVLADEINRASPKTQSSLLEVMEETHVTVDGVTHQVSRPFMVIATQNPIEQAGTYRLPEAQLDRFMLKTSLGYPDHASTMRILEGTSVIQGDLPAILTTQVAQNMSQMVRQVFISPLILDYIARIIEATRQAPQVRLGSSVRGAIALTKSAKTWAASQGRSFVLPDDVKQLAHAVLSHRLILDPEAEFDGVTASAIIAQIMLDVEPPTETP